MKQLVTVVLALAVAGCSLTTEREQPGEQVALAQEEPANCEELGTFFGRSKKPESALNNLLNAVSEDGGNQVFVTNKEVLANEVPFTNNLAFLGNAITLLGDEYVIYGRGFKCPL